MDKTVLAQAGKLLQDTDRLFTAMPNRLPKKRIAAVEAYRPYFTAKLNDVSAQHLSMICLAFIGTVSEMVRLYNSGNKETQPQFEALAGDLNRLTEEVGRYV
ncbi:hypothetical protein K7T73_15890 [Bacillus badius]|uniref:hypothetical protein n=1 Tax=Bacillus badius TaxID=1455 RepID=UPI001CC08DCC|nr:hypothetical protein [Bacillus badius]UAT30019.1 hypothetical protein K7T73_15890 [Bacillus badius]